MILFMSHIYYVAYTVFNILFMVFFVQKFYIRNISLSRRVTLLYELSMANTLNAIKLLRQITNDR